MQIRLKGQPHLSQTFARRSAAREWATSTEAAIRERRAAPGVESRKRTLGDALGRYIEECLPRYSAAELETRRPCLAWWRKRLGYLLLADLTPAAIIEARSLLARSGKKPGTRNRYVAVLSAAVQVAVEDWQWMPENPCRRVRREREPRPTPRFLSEEERDSLLDACRGSKDHRLLPLVIVALSTGARRGELLRMRWRDVDTAAGRALIPQAKSGHPRTVPLVRRAVEALRSMPRMVGDDRLFAPCDWNAIEYRWHLALRESGIAKFRFHDLRHSCASWLALSGASLRDIQEILGHRTIAMAARYSHLTESHLASVAERMADRFLD